MGFAAAKKPDAYGRDEIERTERLYVSNHPQGRPVAFGRLLYEHPSCRMHPAWCVVCSLVVQLCDCPSLTVTISYHVPGSLHR